MRILTAVMFLLTAWASWHHISIFTVLWVMAVPGVPYLFVRDPKGFGRTLSKVTTVCVWLLVIGQALLIAAIHSRR